MKVCTFSTNERARAVLLAMARACADARSAQPRLLLPNLLLVSLCSLALAPFAK